MHGLSAQRWSERNWVCVIYRMRKRCRGMLDAVTIIPIDSTADDDRGVGRTAVRFDTHRVQAPPVKHCYAITALNCGCQPTPVLVRFGMHAQHNAETNKSCVSLKCKHGLCAHRCACTTSTSNEHTNMRIRQPVGTTTKRQPKPINACASCVTFDYFQLT